MSQQSDEKSTGIISNVYDKLILFFHRFFKDLKESIFLFLACLVVTIGLLFLSNQSEKGHYKSSFTVAYDDLVRKIYGDRLEKVNDLLGNNNHAKVARLLNVPQNTAKSLIKIKGTNILGQDLSEDMNTDRIPFIVTITVSDTSKIAALQHGIVGFLEEGNAYMAEKKEIKIREVQQEIDFIDRELRMMDSLKKKYNENSFSASDAKPANSSASTIYQFSYELYKRKQELERKKTMPATVQVLDDAIAPKKTQKGFITVLILGLISGFILYVAMKYFLLPVLRGRR